MIKYIIGIAIITLNMPLNIIQRYIESSKAKKIMICSVIFIILVVLTFFGMQKIMHSRKKISEDKNLNAIREKLEYRTGAVETAKDYMEKIDKDEIRVKYDIEPVKLDNFPDFWNVWFKARDKNKKPDKGLLQINKKTGEVEWKYVQ